MIFYHHIQGTHICTMDVAFPPIPISYLLYVCIYHATFSYNACIMVVTLLIMHFCLTGRKSFSCLFGKQNGWINEVPGCPGSFLLPRALFYCWSYCLFTFLFYFFSHGILSDYQACIHEGSEPIQFFSIFQSFIVFKVWGILICKFTSSNGYSYF